MKLIKREDCPDGYYYAYDKGHKWSVVDFGIAMSTHPMPEGLFLGWEAIRIINDIMDSDTLIRADSWEELEKLI